MFCLQPNIAAYFDLQLTIWMGLLLIYLAVSVLWSDQGEATLKHVGYSLLVMSFCLSIGFCLARYPDFLYWLIFLTITAAMINSGYSIYLHYALPEYQPLPEPRLFAMGRLNNPVISALSYGFATMLCIFFALSRKGLMTKAGFIGVALLLLAAIVLSGSRGVWPALAVGATLGVLLHFKQQRKYQVAGLVVVVICLIGGALALGPEAILQRALSFRPEIWQEFVGRTMAAGFLFGAGMTSDSTFQLPELLIQHPHSIFVSTFYYGGLAGLTLLGLMIGRAVWLVAVMAPGNHRTLSAMLLGFGLTATLFDGNELLTKVDHLWLLIWLPIGLLMFRPEPHHTDRIHRT